MSIRLASCCHMQFTMPNTSTICVMEVYVPTTALQIFIRWNPLRLINSAVKRGYEIRQGVTTLPSPPPPSCFFVATTDNGAAAAAGAAARRLGWSTFQISVSRHNFQTGQKWLDSPRSPRRSPRPCSEIPLCGQNNFLEKLPTLANFVPRWCCCGCSKMIFAHNNNFFLTIIEGQQTFTESTWILIAREKKVRCQLEGNVYSKSWFSTLFCPFPPF